VRLARADQRPLAIELVGRVLGDSVLPAQAQEPLEVTARVTSSAQAATVLAALGDGGVEVAQLSVGDPSLDEVFLALTGKPAEAVAAEPPQP
jgi:ABC-2 type transport system ATP-binding protein